MATGRSRRTVDVDREVADAMKQVKRAMKQVKEATKGMGRVHIGSDGGDHHPPPEGYSAPPPKTKYNVDGTAIKIDKPGAFGKNTHINIKSSKNVQIGNNNVMVINQTSSSKKGRHGRSRHDSSSSSSSSDDERHASTAARGSTKPVVTPDHQDLLTSERLVGDQDVRTASKFMGKSWRRIGRALSVADPELEQIHMDYSREEGIQGVGYRVIQVWRQKAGREAKLGVLTSAICKVYPPEDVLHHFSK